MSDANYADAWSLLNYIISDRFNISPIFFGIHLKEPT